MKVPEFVNADLPDPGPRVAKERLLNALHLTSGEFRPDSNLGWMLSDGPSSHYDDFMSHFFTEHEGSQRTGRETTALVVAGLVLTAYWLQGGVSRRMVEDTFRDAKFNESLIVAPFEPICIERARAYNVSQRAPDDYLVVPPTRLQHIEPVVDARDVVAILPSQAKLLGDQLAAEGHLPYDRSYFRQIDAIGSQPE